jgi:molybdopterin-guanine dinucleotide biosynthesis protein A
MSVRPPERIEITGLILAGGVARRLGGADKGLVQWAGRPLVEWSIAALAPQVGTLIISANRNLPRYAVYGFPAAPDRHPDFPGPLAGIATAMAMASTPWILCLPCDTPCPPADLANRLVQALANGHTEIAAVSDGVRMHPLHALIPVALAGSLEQYLAAGGRSVQGWYSHHRVALADFGDCPNAFANLNTPEDAERLAALFAPRDRDHASR